MNMACALILAKFFPQYSTASALLRIWSRSLSILLKSFRSCASSAGGSSLCPLGWGWGRSCSDRCAPCAETAWLWPKIAELPSCTPSNIARRPGTHFCRGAVHACSSRSRPFDLIIATSARSLWPRLTAWIFAAACRSLGLGLGVEGWA